MPWVSDGKKKDAPSRASFFSSFAVSLFRRDDQIFGEAPECVDILDGKISHSLAVVLVHDEFIAAFGVL